MHANERIIQLLRCLEVNNKKPQFSGLLFVIAVL